MLDNYYSGSLIKLLTSLYPQHPWQIWKFDSVPKGYWNENANQLQFMNWVKLELKINSWQDWYKISSNKIQGNNNIIILFDDV